MGSGWALLVATGTAVAFAAFAANGYLQIGQGRKPAVDCEPDVCGMNSPIIDSAVIASRSTEKPAAARRARSTQITNLPTSPIVGKSHAGRDVLPTITHHALSAAVQSARFGEARGIEGANSPIVDGAAIGPTPTVVKPVTRPEGPTSPRH